MNFLVSTFLLLQAGDAKYDHSSIDNQQPGSTYKCEISDEAGEFSISSDLIPENLLEEFKSKDLFKFSELLDLTEGGSRESIKNLFVEHIDDEWIDESEAVQIVKINAEDYCPQELSTLIDEYNIDADDIFESLLSYSGWEIDGILVSDEPEEVPHTIEICVILACELNYESVSNNISELTGEDFPEECEEPLKEIIKNLKSSFSLSD